MSYPPVVQLPVTPASECELGVFRNASHPSELVADLPYPWQLNSCWDIFKMGCSMNPNNPCLGTSVKVSDYTDGQGISNSMFKYQWLTYDTVANVATVLSNGINKLNLCPTTQLPGYTTSFRFLGILMKNRIEWLIAEQAANLGGITLVPLYDTLGRDALQLICAETELDTVMASADMLPQLIDLLRNGSNCLVYVKRIILVPDSTCLSCCSLTFDGCNYNCLRDMCDSGVNGANAYRRNCQCPTIVQSQLSIGLLGPEATHYLATLATLPNIQLYTWVYLLQQGSLSFSEGPVWTTVKPAATRSTIGTVCYTSGTTGNPKGVCITHENFISSLCGALRGFFSLPSVVITANDCHFSYLPLAHVYERAIVHLAFASGARIGLFSGHAREIMHQIKLLQPTVFISVPRLFERLDTKIQETLSEKPWWQRTLVSVGLEHKRRRRIRHPEKFSHVVWDSAVLGSVRQLLGSRLRYMLVAGAALDPSIAERLSLYFSVPLIEAYGLTEVAGAAFCSHPYDQHGQSLGSPFPSCEFKIESVEELGHKVTNAPPSGELLLRGPSVMSGYLRKGAETNAVLTPDGWFRTGDIVKLHYDGDSFWIRVVDRKKQLFKLSQGEYVAPERLERIYQRIPWIEQLFVTGLPTKAYLVAIVDLNQKEVYNWLETQGTTTASISASFQAWRDPDSQGNAQLRRQLLEMLNAEAIAAELQGFEKVRDVWIAKEPFSVENQQLTPTLKLKRHILNHVYSSAIATMYARTKI